MHRANPANGRVFVRFVPRVQHDRQPQFLGLLHQREDGVGLLQRLSAEQGDAFQALHVRFDVLHQRRHGSFLPTASAPGLHVPASLTGEGAALHPQHPSLARTVDRRGRENVVNQHVMFAQFDTFRRNWMCVLRPERSSVRLASPQLPFLPTASTCSLVVVR